MVRGMSNAFKDWLESSGNTINELSDEWGYSRSYLYGLANGSMKPGRAAAIYIRDATGEAVSVDSWD